MSESVTPIRSEGECYLTRQQVADRLQVGLTTLDKYVKEGMPSYSWGLRVRRFRFSECDRWLHERARKMAA